MRSTSRWLRWLLAWHYHRNYRRVCWCDCVSWLERMATWEDMLGGRRCDRCAGQPWRLWKGRLMTVAELVRKLMQHPGDLPVVFEYDGNYIRIETVDRIFVQPTRGGKGLTVPWNDERPLMEAVILDA